MNSEQRIEMQGEDPIASMIRKALDINYHDISEEILAFQKRRILDNVGTCLAGRNMAGCEASLALAKSYGGADKLQSQRQAQILGTGDWLPVGMAAMQNSIMARALDFCDAIAPGYHPSSTDVPVALAVAQWRKKSGRDVLRALAIAQDIVQRINLCGQSHGSFYNGFDSNVLAPLSGALVAGLIMDLDADTLCHAVGLAFNTASGSFQAYQDKALAVRLAQGLATRSAVESTILAEAGFTGPRNILMGEFGFFNLFVRRDIDTGILLKDFGRCFRGQQETIFKLYPSCGLTLCMTDVALRFQSIHAIKLEDISNIHLTMSSGAAQVCGQKFNPSVETPEVDAAFSAQYVIASALVRNRSTLDEFTPEAVFDPRVGDIARSISMSVNNDFGHDRCRIEIRLKNEECIVEAGEFGRGWPSNPASQAELEAKFRRNAVFTTPEMSCDKMEQIITVIGTLETLPFIGPLVDACIV